MESQFRPGFQVAQGTPPAGQPYATGAPPSPPRMALWLPNVLRVAAIVLTFISAVVMGAARQTTTLVGDITVVSLYTKSTYSAAYVYVALAFI